MTRLALRMLLRDWRAGELRVLALALVIAVMSVTSVGFFADRVKLALVGEAHQLLGADLLIRADHPLDRRYTDEATVLGLRSATALTFISMARSEEAAQLVGVKAVSENYPLRGRLRIARAPNTPDEEVTTIPAPGTVWVDERLLPALDRRVGETIELGGASLRIDALLTIEPDRGVSFFNLAPRVMMNAADVPATGLVQTGSRVTYALYVAGERDAVKAYENWAKAQLGRGERLESLDEARPEMRQSLDRAQQFLGLTALLAVVLAAVAIGLSTQRYTDRHLDGYAVMRCLGATQRRLMHLFAWEFLALGLIACAVGCVLGYFAQQMLAASLAGLVGGGGDLPAPTLLPALQGYATGLVLLLGFALPPLLQLKNVPALRVLRREVGAPQQRAIIAYGAGFVALSVLLVWQAGDVKLGLYVIGGFAAAFALFAAAGYFGLRTLAALGARAPLAWRYGLASLRRRAGSNTVQILSLSLGLTAILLLSFTRNDLLDAWRNRTPADAPNRFVLNIQPDQREPVLDFFTEHRLPAPRIYPMVRGRLMAINGEPVNAEHYADERSRRLVEREFNLSYMETLPGHNQVSAGRWFDEAALREGALSVERGIAKRLGIKVGDRLTWSVGGETFSAPVTNLRSLDWDSMQVNFFVIATPALLERFPTSYITAFHLPGEHGALMHRLAQRFPNLTVVDMSAILRQALSIMERVVQAVQFVFLFALVAGVLVLYAALLATQDERIREAAVMRALGATRVQVSQAQRAEFVALGLLAGLLAAAGASAIGYVLASRVFELPYDSDVWIWLAGPALGLLCVGINTWAGTRAALSRPPIVALRET
ncbi:MAG: FtsX-like permease family protein [Pseudomonadota bacterium]|nr:MAG: ABC transporter permease [Pseudomonadota bacterium]